jgi:hypothetical protein
MEANRVSLMIMISVDALKMLRAINELLLWRAIAKNQDQNRSLVENHSLLIIVFRSPQSPLMNSKNILTKMKTHSNTSLQPALLSSKKKMSFSRTAEKHRKRPHGNPNSLDGIICTSVFVNALTQVCPFLSWYPPRHHYKLSLYLSTSPNTCEGM